ncbi:RNA polymerase Rpb1, domain 5, partial [Pavlovales sp. CCMP2436]
MGDQGIAGLRVTSTHIRKVWRALGVEAARATLISEMTDTMQAGGSSIDVRHIMLVADLMTLSGDVVAVSRYGTNRSGRGPITRSSFEQTVEVLADAGLCNTRDDIKGVSDRIFLGQRTAIGTG